MKAHKKSPHKALHKTSPPTSGQISVGRSKTPTRTHVRDPSCEFVKKRDDTVLRVVWNGDLRLMHTGPKQGSCRRWFFTINGGECSEPKTIDTQLHVKTRGANIHRPAYVEGYCRGVSAGHVNVGWNVGDCQNMNAYNVGDSSTGYKATVRIIVEEVDVEDANTVIV
ncbi:hypothetical protein LSAT2_009740 [Lamellibrachia satsuma]|nr:hypothetical protein LSAT2_009740 [Lamellibrachia satsuma]